MPGPVHAGSAMSTLTRVQLADCSVGDTLPELRIPMDRTLIMATALASQDFEDVHHDPSKANDRGTPDIFMSINSTNGFLDRYLTDIFGPAVRIRRVSLRLGTPNFPGDTMTLTGEVVEASADAVTIAVIGRNANGTHVTAKATLTSSPGGAR